MTKELEALKQVKNFLGHNYCSVDLPNELKLIEQALQRLEAIDNSNPSEALECLEWVINNYIGNDYYVYEEELTTIKQALLKAQEQEKVLEIIKKKNVNVANLIDWFNNSRDTSYEGYLSDYYQEGWFIHFADNDEVDVMYKLTEEEFVLLKGYCNEQDN